MNFLMISIFYVSENYFMGPILHISSFDDSMSSVVVHANKGQMSGRSNHLI